MDIRPNRVKRRLREGRPALVLSGLDTPDLVDMMGPLGFDGVWIEAEHGPVDFGDVADLTRACDLWGMTSIVRVNLNLPGVIYRTLDRGAQGIVVPHVNTAEEARAAVRAAKFAPIGERGMYTGRQGYGVPDYVKKANAETLLVVLIEDIQAVRNLDEILRVDHIDVFFVAPGDLAQTMGYLGEPWHPEVVSVVKDSLSRITRAGRTAGALVTDGNLEEMTESGARFLLTGWMGWVAQGAGAFKARVEQVSG